MVLATSVCASLAMCSDWGIPACRSSYTCFYVFSGFAADFLIFDCYLFSVVLNSWTEFQENMNRILWSGRKNENKFKQFFIFHKNSFVVINGFLLILNVQLKVTFPNCRKLCFEIEHYNADWAAGAATTWFPEWVEFCSKVI